MKKGIIFLGVCIMIVSFALVSTVHGQTTTPTATDTPTPSPSQSVLQAATTPTPTASVPGAPSTGLH